VNRAEKKKKQNGTSVSHEKKGLENEKVPERVFIGQLKGHSGRDLGADQIKISQAYLETYFPLF